MSEERMDPLIPESGSTERTIGRMVRQRGVTVAMASALLLGMTPVFGKRAILAGLPPLAVVAARTAGATGLLLLVMLVVQRRFLYIYPLGLAGCFIAGGLNGIGSLFYYSGLGRIDASMGQLLYALYPIFVAGLLYLDGQRPSRLTIARLLISFPAVYLLTQAGGAEVDLVGVAYMLIASLLYAIHIPINQRILFEVPAPTVTLYTLLAMTLVVIPAYYLFSPPVIRFPLDAAAPLIGLTVVTFLSRLALFTGVKLIGGIQTALIGLGELLVTITLAFFWLRESLNLGQWIGAVFLSFSLLLVGLERSVSQRPRTRGWLYWLRPPLPSNATEATLDSELKKNPPTEGLQG